MSGWYYNNQWGPRALGPRAQESNASDSTKYNRRDSKNTTSEKATNPINETATHQMYETATHPMDATATNPTNETAIIKCMRTFSKTIGPRDPWPLGPRAPQNNERVSTTSNK